MQKKDIHLSRQFYLYLFCSVVTVIGIATLLTFIIKPQVNIDRDNQVLYFSGNIAICFLCVFLVMRRIVFLRIIKDIERIAQSLCKITAGHLNEQVNVRDCYEFDSLSTDINKMVERLKGYIHEAETRMDADLALAKAIQKSALPSQFPAFPDRRDFDVYACMLPAKEVGGDFYDFYFSYEDRFTITIADVSGKGIPAAMFMMRGKSTLKDVITTGIPLDEACRKVNDILCQGNDTDTFFTGWIGSIDLKNGVVTYVNAGHNSPVIRRSLHVGDGMGEVAFLPCEAGVPMAVCEGFEYRTETIQLHPGDEIYLYTDGVTEAANREERLFGDERLIGSLNAMPLSEVGMPKDICGHVLNDVQQFADGAEQSDDITMLCFKYMGQ